MTIDNSLISVIKAPWKIDQKYQSLPTQFGLDRFKCVGPKFKTRRLAIDGLSIMDESQGGKSYRDDKVNGKIRYKTP